MMRVFFLHLFVFLQTVLHVKSIPWFLGIPLPQTPLSCFWSSLPNASYQYLLISISIVLIFLSTINTLHVRTPSPYLQTAQKYVYRGEPYTLKKAYYNGMKHQVVMEGGKLSDKFALLQLIAEGSYGEVYKAQDRHSKEIVAVKRFKGATKIGLPTSFVREHYIMTVLGGKAVPKIIEVFSQEDPPALVMEWLAISLEQLLKSKKKYAIKEFFTELVEAIEELHNQDVLHRDLKPSNIMLKCKGGPLAEPLEVSPKTYELKVIDFGMARQAAWEGRDMTNQVGSMHYRAPELLLGQTKYTNKVDIWALGCIFYYMQTGKTLFRAHNEIDQLKNILSVIGSDLGKVKNTLIREGLVKWKLEGVNEGWEKLPMPLNEIELDFLKKMMVLEPQSRLTCKELLQHPYFI